MRMMVTMNHVTHGMWNGMMNSMMQMAPWLGVLWLLVQLGVLALVVFGIVWLVRTLRDTSDRRKDSALEILRECYARGDIDEEEFRERKRQLASPAADLASTFGHAREATCAVPDPPSYRS